MTARAAIVRATGTTAQERTVLIHAEIKTVLPSKVTSHATRAAVLQRGSLALFSRPLEAVPTLSCCPERWSFRYRSSSSRGPAALAGQKPLHGPRLPVERRVVSVCRAEQSLMSFPEFAASPRAHSSAGQA